MFNEYILKTPTWPDTFSITHSLHVRQGILVQVNTVHSLNIDQILATRYSVLGLYLQIIQLISLKDDPFWIWYFLYITLFQMGLFVAWDIIWHIIEANNVLPFTKHSWRCIKLLSLLLCWCYSNKDNKRASIVAKKTCM